MSAGVIGFILGMFAGGTIGASAMCLVSAGGERKWGRSADSLATSIEADYGITAVYDPLRETWVTQCTDDVPSHRRCLLLSERAAAERAAEERAAAHRWELSEREKELVRRLGNAGDTG